MAETIIVEINSALAILLKRKAFREYAESKGLDTRHGCCKINVEMNCMPPMIPGKDTTMRFIGVKKE